MSHLLGHAARLLCISFLATQAVVGQEQPKFVPEDELPMSASQVAQAAGFQPYFDWLKKEAAAPGQPLREVLVRQQLLLQVTAASLQVDAASGQIDAEIADIKELQNYLEARRERQINLLNLASLAVGGSLGTASATLGLAGEGKASNITGVLAGGVITTLSVIGLRRKRGESQQLQVPSNMLANLFGRPVVPNNAYPPIVEAFMKSVSPNEKEGLTRQQRLIQSWIKVKRIPNPDSAAGKEKILRLTSSPAEERKLSIGDLNDRQAMLYDFRAKLLFLKRDLAVLLANVPKSAALANLDLTHP